MKILRPEEITKDTILKYDGTPEELAEVYRLAREAFTAADLQKYTEPFDGFPLDEFMQEMEEQQVRLDAQRKQS